MQRLSGLWVSLLLIGPAQAADDEPAVARVTVKLPAEARLFVGDRLVPYTGPSRTITTPQPLEPGKDYHYRLRATIERNGRIITVTKAVDLRAGDDKVVDFGTMRSNGAAAKSTAGEGPTLGTTAAANDPLADPAAALGLPGGMPPRIQSVRVHGKEMTLRQLVCETKQEARTAKRKTPEGKEEEYSYTVTVCMYKPVFTTAKLAGYMVTDAQGKPVDEATLGERLKEESAVLFSDGLTLPDSRYLEAFKPDTLVFRPKPHQIQPSSVAPAPGQAAQNDSADDEAPIVRTRLVQEAPRAAPQAPSTAPAAPGMATLQFPPPEIRVGRLHPNGDLTLCSPRTYRNHAPITKIVKDGDKMRPITVLQRESSFSLASTVLAPNEFKRLNPNGDPTSIDEATKERLESPGVVLAMFENRGVDPLYTSIVRPEVAIFSVSKHDSCGGGPIGQYAPVNVAPPPPPVPQARPVPAPAPAPKPGA